MPVSKRLISAFLMLFISISAFAHTNFITQEKQYELTPQKVLQRLKNGNDRYVTHHAFAYDQRESSALAAKYGQSPMALVLLV